MAKKASLARTMSPLRIGPKLTIMYKGSHGKMFYGLIFKKCVNETLENCSLAMSQLEIPPDHLHS